ncbi:MAG: hypothetical protein LW832_09540 [Parachlamydia sp.]|jgi:hypothetical protein|nr:hypothetical protein [Parachlamydia sp.]
MLTQQVSLKQQICEGSLKGATGFISGILTQEQGVIEATKALFEGYMQAMQKYSDSASKAADSAAGNTREIA